MASGVGYTVEVDGLDRVNAALRRVQPNLRDATIPVMENAAREIAAGAQVRVTGHPSGLWKSDSGRSLTPSYRTARKGTYLFKVKTPGTQAGRAEAMSEFARLAVTKTGAAMVRALTASYGRPGGSGGGRILWAEADEVSEGLMAQIESAVARAAERTEGEM